MRGFYTNLLDASTWLIIVFYFVLSFFLTFVDNNFVGTDELYVMYLDRVNSEKYNEYDDYVADFEEDLADIDLGEESEDALNLENAFWDLLFIAIEFLITVLIVSVLFYGILILALDLKELPFSKVLKPVIYGNFIFLLPLLISLIWFGLFQTDYDYQSLIEFKPLYLSSLFSNGDLSETAKRFIDIFNAYAIGFVWVTAKGMHILQVHRSFQKLLRHTTLIYLLLIISWNILVTYLISVL